MRKTRLSLAFAVIAFFAFMGFASAQTAKLQIIHNSADAVVDEVDIYVNGASFLTDVGFRQATNFMDVPAGVDLNIVVAPVGAGIENGVGPVTVNLTENETYIAIASGIVSATGYDPATPFSLEVFTGARETANEDDEVDLLVFHGVTDAPSVNVGARYVATIVTDAAYTDFAGYVSVPASYYTLDIAANAAPDDVLISFGADLRTLAGGSATVLASGFLNPSNNSDGAGFALIAVLADGTVVELPVVQEFEGTLGGLVEVPANLSNGNGSVGVTLAGNVLQLAGSFSDLTGTYTMSHIHRGAAGNNGGVAFGLTADSEAGEWSAFDNIFDLTSTDIDELNNGELYVNLHTNEFPAGEIRAQILSSPNNAPSASEITAPADGAEITLTGTPDTPFVPSWSVATDPDADNVVYVWQLAADSEFNTIIVNASTGADAQFEADFGTVDALLDAAGVNIGDEITLYHRAISTDGSEVTIGTAASVVITRGFVGDFARAQIIHNAADMAAANVDVFVNGEMFVPDFAFRTATPFVDVPAGVELTIDVAPAGAGIENSVFDITVTFDADETYVIIANGIVSATGYDPVEPFTVYPFAPAREAGENANETDLLVFHGSTDAPEVSVWAMGGESALFTFEYGQFAGYLGLPTDDYVLEVRTADGETTVVSYVAPLATLELEGAALTVVASGFLNPANNSDGPAFGLFVATADGGELIALPVYEPEPETARAQIIHNAADMAAANVDVFVNGEIFVPDFAFRTATPFVDVPAGVELTIDVAPAGAGIENSVFDITVTFDADETYVIIANGIVSATGYDPVEPFTVYPFAPAREAGENANETDLLVFHGSTDAPEVSVWAMGGESALFTFEYGQFAGYLGLPTDDYVLEVRTADGETTVVSYVAPLATLELEGAALTVVASGFLNPANNSNGPAFGLFVATPAGGELIALPVYEEQEPVIVGFPFFEDFETPENYSNWIIIDGSGSGFGWEISDNDNFIISDPMGGSFASVDSDAAGSGNYVWSILQAPIIDLADFEGGNIELSFAHHYRQIGAQEAYVKISNDGENWETIATYNSDQGSSAGFSGPFDVTAVSESLIIEGYTSSDSLWIRFEFDDNEVWGWYWIVDNISVNVASDEPEFARAQIIHNAADMAAANVDVFVNGEIFVPDFAFRTATPFVDVPAGVELTIDVAPAGAGIESSVFDINVTFEADQTYIIVANGIVSETGYDPVEPFTVYPFAGAREEATNENETDVLVFHGSTDAPEVSVWETGVGAGELFTFGYGDYAGYLELGTLDYVLEVRTADGETTVVAYSAPLQTLELDGAAITVVASGFLNPANNSNGPAFGLFVATAAGGDLIALPVYEAPEPEFARAQIIHNAADMAAANVDVFVNGEIFVPDFAFRTATPFVDVPAGVELTIDIAPAGAGIESSVFDITVEFDADETYIIIANGIVSASGYDPAEAFTVYPFAGAREAATNANETDVLVFHGATDAPEVSVWETGVGAGELFSFTYGQFAGYLGLGTLDYVLEVRTADGETTVAAYSAPLQTLELDGAAITVVASGFLNPANNSNGPAFGLYVATAAGGDLIALPVVTNVDLVNQVFGNFNVYPNPVRENLNIMLQMNRSGNVSVEIFNILGSRVYVNELGNRSDVVMETINVSFLPQGTYIMNIRTSDDVITRKINVIK